MKNVTYFVGGIYCILVNLFIPNSAALAFCSEPSMFTDAPEVPSSLLKPSPPYCLSGYSYTRKHTCDRWEIDSYIGEINDYIRKLNNYAEEARNFAEDAISFANDASDYARCVANEIRSELQ